MIGSEDLVKLHRLWVGLGNIVQAGNLRLTKPLQRFDSGAGTRLAEYTVYH